MADARPGQPADVPSLATRLAPAAGRRGERGQEGASRDSEVALATEGGRPDSWGVCHLQFIRCGWGRDLRGTVQGPAWVMLLLTDSSLRQRTLVAIPRGAAPGLHRTQSS